MHGFFFLNNHKSISICGVFSNCQNAFNVLHVEYNQQGENNKNNFYEKSVKDYGFTMIKIKIWI